MRLERQTLSVSLKVINYWSLPDSDALEQAWECRRSEFPPTAFESRPRGEMAVPGPPVAGEAGARGFPGYGVGVKSCRPGRGMEFVLRGPSGEGAEP